MKTINSVDHKLRTLVYIIKEKSSDLMTVQQRLSILNDHSSQTVIAREVHRVLCPQLAMKGLVEGKCVVEKGAQATVITAASMGLWSKIHLRVWGDSQGADCSRSQKPKSEGKEESQLNHRLTPSMPHRMNTVTQAKGAQTTCMYCTYTVQYVDTHLVSSQFKVNIFFIYNISLQDV